MQKEGITAEVVDFPSERIPAAGREVSTRLRAILGQDPDFDVVFVHRDAEKQDPALRYKEVQEGAARAGFGGPSVAVVPIQMTEAWLLLDEQAIRLVAGRPNGKYPIGLPPLKMAETHADPKQCLREALVSASGLTGRKLAMFRRQFSVQRQTLIEMLDPEGDVSNLTAWARLHADIRGLVKALSS